MPTLLVVGRDSVKERLLDLVAVVRPTSDTDRAQPPEHHFGLIHNEPRGTGGFQAWCEPDDAVDVLGSIAVPTDEVMMVVRGARLEPCGVSGWFDSAQQLGRGTRVQYVVDRLRGHGVKPFSHSGGDLVRGRVWVRRKPVEHRKPWRGDPQSNGTQQIARLEPAQSLVVHRLATPPG